MNLQRQKGRKVKVFTCSHLSAPLRATPPASFWGSWRSGSTRCSPQRWTYRHTGLNLHAIRVNFLLSSSCKWQWKQMIPHVSNENVKPHSSLIISPIFLTFYTSVMKSIVYLMSLGPCRGKESAWCSPRSQQADTCVKSAGLNGGCSRVGIQFHSQPTPLISF